jgi:hypothetical protein
MTSRRSAGTWLAFLCVLWPSTVLATYSIVAADRATRQVGGAVTSCVGGSVAGVYGSAPGKGAVAAQAASNRAGRDEAVRLLLMDVAPQQIITRITSAMFDPASARRQYGASRRPQRHRKRQLRRGPAGPGRRFHLFHPGQHPHRAGGAQPVGGGFSRGGL